MPGPDLSQAASLAQLFKGGAGPAAPAGVSKTPQAGGAMALAQALQGGPHPGPGGMPSPVSPPAQVTAEDAAPGPHDSAADSSGHSGLLEDLAGAMHPQEGASDSMEGAIQGLLKATQALSNAFNKQNPKMDIRDKVAGAPKPETPAPKPVLPDDDDIEQMEEEATPAGKGK